MAQAMGTRRTGRVAPERGVTLCHTMFATSGNEILRPVPGLRSSNARFPTASALRAGNTESLQSPGSGLLRK